MAYNNPYGAFNAYKEVGVKTASRGKLVVMLYEGAVNNLEKAMALIGADGKIAPSNIEPFGKYIQKVMDIINELQVSLNMEQGGEIAQNLLSLYVYFNKQLLEASIKHEKKTLEFIHNMMSQLKDSWEQAANSTANTQSMSTMQPTLNIRG